MVRATNIVLRTAHLVAMGVLLGGHVFDVEPARLKPLLWLTIGTGVALAMVEAGPRLVWFHQGRGLLTLAKLALMSAVPFAWDYRVPILVAVAIIGSIGSHMPARYRYYSVLLRQFIPDTAGPGGRRSTGGSDGSAAEQAGDRS
jgi:hypothetical protein